MKKFLQSNGEPQWGLLTEPVGTINYMDYPLRSPFREMLPQEERRLRFVHFHFMGFTSKQFIAGCSITLVGDTKTAFFYLFDRKSKELIKFGFKLPKESPSIITLNPDDGQTTFTQDSKIIKFESNLAEGSKALLISSGDDIELELNFSERDHQFETLRLCTPTGSNGWTYCQKVAGIPASGILKYKGNSFSLAQLGATAHHDFTAGFLRKDTFWNWACITGIQPNGDIIGLNVSNGVNETGNSENRVWLNGKSSELGHFMFSYNPDALDEDWYITSNHGTNLTFKSEGKYSAFNNKITSGYDFHQLFGKFSGDILTHTGKRISITNLAGFCERQYSIWYD